MASDSGSASVPSETRAQELWRQCYDTAAKEGWELLWPSETLVRLFKGSYVPDLDRNYGGKSVLDVGCGNGNNLLFLGTLGLQLFGTETSEALCAETRERLRQRGLELDIRPGTN